MSRQWLDFMGEVVKRLSAGDQTKRLLVTHHGIENGEHLAHTSSDVDFLLLPSFHQLVILWLEDRVVANASQRGHVEGIAHCRSSALGPAVASFSATVLVHGCYPHQGCNLLAVQSAQLR